MKSRAHLQTHYQMACEEGGRETDKQVGKQTKDIYVGRIGGGQTKMEDKNKTERGENTEAVDSLGCFQKLKRDSWLSEKV